MTDRQMTIARPVTYSGVGLHSGHQCHMTFLPAAAGTGLRFVRTDLQGMPQIVVDPDHVVGVERGTTIGVNGTQVQTIEHVLAALLAGGFDYPGHTEMLAALCGGVSVAMMMVAEETALGGPLRVVLATTHLALSQVPSAVTVELLCDRIQTLEAGRGGERDDGLVGRELVAPHTAEVHCRRTDQQQAHLGHVRFEHDLRGTVVKLS